MRIFKIKTTWTNAELYVFKLGVFAAGILFGAYLGAYMLPYIGWFWALAVVGCFAAGYFWVQKVEK